MTDELNKRIDEARQLAEDAFWAVVAEKFPEAKSGDFDPMATFNMETSMRNWIKLWVEWNVPATHYREHSAIEIPVFLRQWEDVSYHNDLCARSEYQIGKHTITIWVERADPADREHPDGPQFIVEFCPDGDLNAEGVTSLYEGDDASQVAQWARAAEIVGRQHADDDMDATDKAERICALIAEMETK